MIVEDDTANQFHESAIDLRVLPNKHNDDDLHPQQVTVVHIVGGTPCRSDENGVLVVPEMTSPLRVNQKLELFTPSSLPASRSVSRLQAHKSRSKNSVNRNPTRMLMRDWLLQQAASGSVPGLKWLDREETLIQIPWIHGSKTEWSRDNHCRLFENWAIYTGKYQPGADEPNPRRWKANFRCALNSLQDVKMVSPPSQVKGERGFKVYRFMPSEHQPGSSREDHRGRTDWRLMNNLRRQQKPAAEPIRRDVKSHSDWTVVPTTVGEFSDDENSRDACANETSAAAADRNQWLDNDDIISKNDDIKMTSPETGVARSERRSPVLVMDVKTIATSCVQDKMDDGALPDVQLINISEVVAAMTAEEVIASETATMVVVNNGASRIDDVTIYSSISSGESEMGELVIDCFEDSCDVADDVIVSHVEQGSPSSSAMKIATRHARTPSSGLLDSCRNKKYSDRKSRNSLTGSLRLSSVNCDETLMYIIKADHCYAGS